MNYRSRSSGINWENMKAWAFLIALGLILTAGVIFGIKTAYEAGGKMSLVIVNNKGYWIVIILAFVFGFFRKFTNPQKFNWLELPAQLLISFVAITALYAFFYNSSTPLVDTEVWNGQVIRGEYYEAWTERKSENVCDSRDKNGHCTSSHIRYYNVRHSPEWKLCTTVGDIDVSASIYATYVRYWHNEAKKDLYHANQVSVGDGDMFYVRPNNDLIVPASTEHKYVNYLRASDSIKKVSGSISGFQKFLKNYPRVHSSQFGPLELDRVILAGVRPSNQWVEILDRKLDLALVKLGSSKQVNILVYLVGTADQSFSYALEEQWIKGKKNDVIVIIGSTNFPKPDFVYVMAWTKVEEFKITLRDRIMAMPDLNNSEELADIICSQINKGPQNGGFDRMPMAELEYLIGDIKLPWWCQVLIVLVGGGISWATSWYMVNNDF
jgi:hypothetical protein